MPSYFQRGKYFYDKHQYRKAFEYFQRSVKFVIDDDVEQAKSLWHIGVMFKYGFGVVPNIDLTTQFMKKSAEMGNTAAMNSLGHIYLTANHEMQDRVTAAKYFEQGALLGNIDCQVSIANMYDQGDGIPQDHVKAFYWFSEGSKHGDIDATYNLAIMHQDGEGVHKNNTKAQRYFCDAGEYSLKKQITGLELVSKDTLNRCSYDVLQSNSANYDLEGMCNTWINKTHCK